MNILDVIRDCVSNPFLLKDYDLEEFTVGQLSDTQTITGKSAFSGFSLVKKLPNTPKPLVQQLMRMHMRVWTGLVKFIAKALADGNCFADLSLGYFYPAKGKCTYSPSSDILEKYGYELKTDSWNVHPAKLCV
eukprot:TRINITY_DN16437_c0_g1_i1.p2 TRINITY_DN16437_c0_g1~~TRINITY_DN16437_c0_g1_i1.p2  ORF type:complete len:133 (-),score=27.66 TRINITY_DN16437_c0_g1_i1:836-1234(-)